MTAADMLGVGLGLLVVLPILALSRSKNYDPWLYSVSLLGLPLIYMAFGAFARGESVVTKELAYGLPFIAIGIVGLRVHFKFSAYVIAAFWLAHGGYDLFHDSFFINTGVWAFYPAFCAIFDLSVGLYLLWAASTWPRSEIKLAGQRTSAVAG